MAFKALLVACASALLVNTISGQCIGSLNNGLGNGIYGLAGNGLIGNGLINNGYLGNGCSGCGAGLNGLCGLNNGLVLSQSGGALGVSSASPIGPSGLSVLSENAIEGTLACSGTLPFLAAVALEGQLPSAGSAGVSYSCGNGNVGIVSEGLGAGINGLGYGSGLSNLGLAGVNGLGCGSGLSNLGLAGINGLGCGSGLSNLGLVGSCGCGIY